MKLPAIWRRLWVTRNVGVEPAMVPPAGARTAQIAAVERTRTQVRVPDQPMRPHEHWTKAARAIESTIGRTRQLTVLQQQAALQLDSASYAFAELLTDLATAMPLPRLAAAPVVASVGPRPEHRAVIKGLAQAA